MEVDRGPRRVRRLPALHLLEGPPEVLGRELLAVLVAKALAQPHLQGRLVDPGGLLHRRPDDVAPFVGPDRLLHRIPGDEQPVQRMRVDHLDGPDGSRGRRGCHDASSLGQLPSGWHTRWSMGRTRSPRWMTSRWPPSPAAGRRAGRGSIRVSVMLVCRTRSGWTNGPRPGCTRGDRWN